MTTLVDQTMLWYGFRVSFAFALARSACLLLWIGRYQCCGSSYVLGHDMCIIMHKGGADMPASNAMNSNTQMAPMEIWCTSLFLRPAQGFGACNHASCQ